MDKTPRKPEYKDFETKQLFSVYKDTKDLDVRNELVKRNLFMSEIISRKYMNRGIEYEDILQVASLGLIYAIERFDIDKGFEFSSFATPTIIGEIKKYFRDKGWVIRVPRRIQELSKKVNQARAYLEKELNRVPKIKDIADYLDLTEDEVIETMEASGAYSPMSLDVKYSNASDDSDISIFEIIGERDSEFEKIEDRDFLLNVMEILNKAEKKIVYDRYYLLKTQKDVAKDLNVSQMTISRMEKKILKKLKKEYDSQINM